jgi:SAM-dependent methyltransferase
MRVILQLHAGHIILGNGELRRGRSYLSFPFPSSAYDYVLAVQTLHHLLRDTKSDLYKKIGKSLKPAGRFINADDMVSAVEEERRPAEYGYDRSRYSERLPF